MKPHINTHKRGRKLSTCLKLLCCWWGGPTPCWISANNPSSESSLEDSNLLGTSHTNTLQAAWPGQAWGRAQGLFHLQQASAACLGKRGPHLKNHQHTLPHTNRNVFCTSARRDMWGSHSAHTEQLPCGPCAICNRTVFGIGFLLSDPTASGSASSNLLNTNISMSDPVLL